MSYARFSSDDYQSDVYVYESQNGFETHVAARRCVFKGPLPPAVPFAATHIDAFVARAAAVGALVDRAERVPIDLPHAGESFIDPDPLACAERLQHLRSLGYRVPQYAIDALRAEASDAGLGPTDAAGQAGTQ